MGRKVKCQITKEVGDSTVFYKAPNGKYYKTEQTYKDWKRESDNRLECINLICEYAGYKDGGYAPTFLHKMVSDFGKKLGYDILLETIKDREKDFLWANEHKDFESELSRLFYYKSIIGNHIIDIYIKHQKESKYLIKDNVSTDYYEGNNNVERSTGNGKDVSQMMGEMFGGFE